MKKKLKNGGFMCMKLPRMFIIMKTILLLLVCSLNLNAAVFSQQKKFDISMREAAMSEVFRYLHRMSEYRFVYDSDAVNRMGRVSVEMKDVKLEDVLRNVLEGSRFDYLIEDGLVIIREKKHEIPQAHQVRKISGTVTSKQGDLLPGVTVILKGTTIGSVTDADGVFKFEVPADKGLVLVFSFIGMKKQEVTYKGEPEMKVVMEEEVAEMDEVVVTGIFKRRKEGFTGSATTVSGDEIKKMTSGNVLKALEMLDPGFRMNVSNVMGSNPNAVPDFQMRGQASMGNYEGEDFVMLRGDYNTRPNQPLFVLDGIIGVNVTSIMDIDPEQVESITVLKDAAATVIYGSEAANGVVVVETKAPVAGKLRFSYNGNYKLQIPDLRDYNLLDAKGKLELEELAGYFDNTDDMGLMSYYRNLQLEVQRGVNTYWLSKPLRTAFAHRHGLNVEGGDRSLRYKLYMGINLAPGVMRGSDLTTKSGKIDIQYRFGKFLVSNQLYIDYSSGQRTSPYGSFSEYALINPYYRPYDENGNIKKVLDDHNAGTSYVGRYNTPTLNPLYNTLFETKDENRDFELKEALKVEYMPTENLRLSLDFSLSRNDGQVEIFKPAQHTSFDTETDPTQKGSFSSQKTEGFNYRLSISGAYNKAFRQDHLFSAYGRYTINESSSDMTNLLMKGFPNDKLSEVYLGTTFNTLTGNEAVDRALGFLFTLNYSYKQRYAVDYSMRIDASSQFGRNNRYAPFWSTGLRWNVDRENFIRKLGVFDELVIRGTYGITGSQGFSSYQALQMYTYRNMMKTYKSSDVVGTTLLGVGNPDLKWQQTENYNISLDFSLLKNKVSARLEYYEKYTKNTLLDYSLAPSVGFSDMKENLGRISNKGMEATLRVMPYSNPQRRAYWNIVVIGSKNKSRIEQISNALKVQNEKQMNDVKDRPLPRYENGYSQSVIWAVRSLGIDPLSGREMFLTRDGKPTNVWNAADQVPVGDTEPKFIGSLSTTFNYAGFSLNVAGRFKWGGQVYNSTLISKIENANMRLNVDERALKSRWKNPGDPAYFKAINRNVYFDQTKATSRFVMNDNEFSISTINLSYRWEGRDCKWMKHAGLTSASLGLYMEDLVRFSTVKMERGTAYPFSRQMSMSFNVIF